MLLPEARRISLAFEDSEDLWDEEGNPILEIYFQRDEQVVVSNGCLISVTSCSLLLAASLIQELKSAVFDEILAKVSLYSFLPDFMQVGDHFPLACRVAELADALDSVLVPARVWGFKSPLGTKAI